MSAYDRKSRTLQCYLGLAMRFPGPVVDLGKFLEHSKVVKGLSQARAIARRVCPSHCSLVMRIPRTKDQSLLQACSKKLLTCSPLRSVGPPDRKHIPSLSVCNSDNVVVDPLPQQDSVSFADDNELEPVSNTHDGNAPRDCMGWSRRRQGSDTLTACYRDSLVAKLVSLFVVGV